MLTRTPAHFSIPVQTPLVNWLPLSVCARSGGQAPDERCRWNTEWKCALPSLMKRTCCGGETGAIHIDVLVDWGTVCRMETITISPKFQVVIPRKIREAMGLPSGGKAKMVAFRNRIEIIAVREVRSLRGYLKGMDASIVRDGDRL